MDYTAEYFYEYSGEEWVILQNGEKIVMAKKSALVKLDEYKFALMDDSQSKKNILCLDISDVDIIIIRK